MSVTVPLAAGTHNLFDEERFSLAQAHAFKTEIAQHVARKIDERRMTVGDAAQLCDCPQADIKRICRSEVMRFTVEEMVWIARQFGFQMNVHISVPKDHGKKQLTKTQKAN